MAPLVQLAAWSPYTKHVGPASGASGSISFWSLSGLHYRHRPHQRTAFAPTAGDPQAELEWL